MFNNRSEAISVLKYYFIQNNINTTKLILLNIGEDGSFTWNEATIGYPKPADQVLIDLKPVVFEIQNKIQARYNGIQYNGVTVSFLEDDRRAVLEAEVALHKKAPDDTYYIADGVKITIRFANGNQLAVDRNEFDTAFFPVFFAAASAEFLA